MQRLKTVRVRFALWTATLLLAILVAFSLYVYGSLASRLSAAHDESLRLAHLQAVAALEDVPPWSANEPEIAQLLARGYSIRVTTPDGNPLWTVGPEHDWPGPATRYTTLPESTSVPPLRVWSSLTMLNQSLMVVVQVAQSLAEVEATLAQLRLALFISVPLLVTVAGAGGYFLAARALAPIDTITRTARRLSAANLSERLDLPATDDEVGRLAATFDEMLARLDGAFRRERQFTADASHELRTPLAAMQTILNTVRERPRPAAEYEQALADLADEIDRLRLLTESLLQLGREEKSAAHEAVDLSTLLHDVADSMQPLAEARALGLSCHVPDGLTVCGDRDELVRLFVNLLDNAMKFTWHGTITLTASRDADERICVSVADTGPGIPAEHLPRIFDRFYRVEHSRTTPGAGLGLAIVAAIAHAHDAAVTARSTEGVGTTVVVCFPPIPT